MNKRFWTVLPEEGVNLRAEPKVTAEKIALLPCAALVTVIDEGPEDKIDKQRPLRNRRRFGGEHPAEARPGNTNHL